MVREHCEVREGEHITRRIRQMKVDGRAKRGKPKNAWKKTVTRDQSQYQMEKD